MALAVDAAGNLLVGGVTASADFKVSTGASKPSLAGANTGFYMLLKPDAH